jgi:hypothetical protein
MRTAFILFISCFSISQAFFGQVNVLTQHNDIGRTGQNTNETILTPSNVGSGNFGKLFSEPVDGQVFAQPLYVAGISIPGAGTHNVAFVVTMHDSVYAFDADNGTKLWQITLLDAAHGAAAGATTDPASDTGCYELAGSEFGITSTPVIDPSAGAIYVVGRTFENGGVVQRLHKLSLTSGAEMTNSPVALAASVNGTGLGSSNGVLSFDPKWENQRPGLLLVNGIVYIGFAGYCDFGTWHGWILAYNTSTMAQTSVFTPTPNSEGSGIWMSGTGLAADVPAGSPYGRMFVPLGNGTYDATTPYGTNTMDYGVGVVRLDLQKGMMRVTDAFTPFDQAYLNQNDQDMASGGVIILPDQPLAGHTHQLLAAGKTGNIYVVDRDNMGDYNTTRNNIIEYIAPNQIGGEFSAPAYWNSTVYYWGDEDTLKQFDVTNGLLNEYHSENSNEVQTYPGSTPSISSNGASNGIVWDLDGSAYGSGGDSILYAHDATNVSITLYSSATNAARDSAGPAMQMTTPTVANGKVYVGARGQLSVYGLLNPNFSLSASPSSLSIQQGASSTDTVTVDPVNGFTGGVTFTASGLPTGMTAGFKAGSTSGTTVVTFAVAAKTVAATYPIVITGTSSSLTHTVTVAVTVTSASGPPSFTISAATNPLVLAEDTGGSSKINISAKGGFNGSVTFYATGLPAGMGYTFTPASSTSASTFSTFAPYTIAAGTYPITIIGTSGSLTATCQLSLKITAVRSFTLSATESASLADGHSVVTNVTVVPDNGFNSAVSLVAGNVPTGVTASFGTNPVTSSTTLTFAASSSAASGTYYVTVIGNSGSISSAVNIELVIGSGSAAVASVN